MPLNGRLETLALFSACVTVGCTCCTVGPILIGLQSDSIFKTFVMLSGVWYLSTVPHVSTNTHRGLATPITYESYNNHRLLNPSFTKDLAIRRQIYAAHPSTVGVILTGENACTVAAPAAVTSAMLGVVSSEPEYSATSLLRAAFNGSVCRVEMTAVCMFLGSTDPSSSCTY